MKKILIFSTNYLPNIGGAELAIKEITDRLPDIACSLITARLKPSLGKEEVLGRVSVYRVGFGVSFDKFLLPLLGFVKALSLHRKERFSAVWCMMASQASVAAAFFKLAKRHVPLVLTLQEGDEEEHLKRYVFGNETLYRILIQPWHTFVFRVADRITVISAYLGSRARRHAPATPITVVPNAVDYEGFSRGSNPEARAEMRKQYGFSHSDFVVVTVSRLVKKNCVDDSIKAVSLLPSHVKLLVIGSGPLEGELKKLTGDLGLTERVLFTGDVLNEKLPRSLATADVFVRPSLSEGLGTAFIEAMAARIPVIATPVGGIVDFLTDKKTGLFCGVRDPKDLGLKIEVVMKDQDLRLGLIEEAETMAKERYGWDRIAKLMCEDGLVPLEKLDKARILITTGIFPPDIGGPAKYAKHLAETFREAGYPTSVLPFGKSKLPSGLRHLAFSMRLLIPLFLSDWVLTLDTVSVGLPSVVLGRLLGKKVVVRVGGDFVWEHYVERTGDLIPLPEFYTKRPHLTFKERLVFLLTKTLLRRASRVAFNTEWQRKLWLAPYSVQSERSVVVENYYGERLPSEKPKEKNFIWAGRQIRLKNIPRLKAAFAQAHGKCPAITLETFAVSHEELLARMRRAYAVVVPSVSEVSPNLILEAVRLGKPFIATKYCGLHEKLKDLGLWVDPLSNEGIAKALCSLADDVVYQRFLENNARFKHTRGWKEVANDYIHVFKTR